MALLLSSTLAFAFTLAAIKFKIVDFWLKTLLPIPKTIFLPVVMLIFGVGEISKIVFLLLFTLFTLTYDFKTIFSSTDNETTFLLKKAGLKNPKLFIESVLLPSLPLCIASLIRGYSSSFSVLILIENFGTLKGLGFFMLDSFLKMKYKEMTLTVIISALLGGIFPQILQKVISKYWPWHQTG